MAKTIKKIDLDPDTNLGTNAVDVEVGAKFVGVWKGSLMPGTNVLSVYYECDPDETTTETRNVILFKGLPASPLPDDAEFLAGLPTGQQMFVYTQPAA